MKIKYNIRSCKLSFLLILCAMCLSACTNDQNISKDSSSVTRVSPPTSSAVVVTPQQEVSSNYYMNMGVLDENIARNGGARDEADILITNDKLLMPQGILRSVAIENWARKCMGYRASKEIMGQFLDAVESAKIVRRDQKTINQGKNISLHLVYLNSHAEFRTIHIDLYGKGLFAVSQQEDDIGEFAKTIPISDKNKKKKEMVYLHNNKVSKIIKEVMSFENYSKDNLTKITGAFCETGTDTGERLLSEKQLEKLKRFLQSDMIAVQTPCDSQYFFAGKLPDGNTVHFSISSDGDFLSMDSVVYKISSK